MGSVRDSQGMSRMGSVRDSHFLVYSGASLSYSFLIISLNSHLAYIVKSTISLQEAQGGGNIGLQGDSPAAPN